MALRIGQRVRIVGGLPYDPRELGLGEAYLTPLDAVATVVAGPMRWTFEDWAWPHAEKMGYPRTMVGFVVQRDNSEVRTWGPPEWYEPIDDGREAVEWTEELRRLCGKKAGIECESESGSSG